MEWLLEKEMERIRPLDHRITKIEYGVLATRSQDTQGRIVEDFMGSNNPSRRAIITEIGKLDRRKNRHI